MRYAHPTLRGREIEIEYRILEYGPGFGWTTEWDCTCLEDRKFLGFPDAALSDAELEIVNNAINAAEGRS